MDKWQSREEGYRNFGFDTKFLDAAYEISAKEVQR